MPNSRFDILEVGTIIPVSKRIIRVYLNTANSSSGLKSY